MLSCWDKPVNDTSEHPNVPDVETTVMYPLSRVTRDTVDGEIASVQNVHLLLKDKESWQLRLGLSKYFHPWQKLFVQVALRRQQAQEEAEARQLGVEILKPGDRADLVMGTDGILRREGEHEVAEADTENKTEESPQKKIKVDSFEEEADQGTYNTIFEWSFSVTKRL